MKPRRWPIAIFSSLCVLLPPGRASAQEPADITYGWYELGVSFLDDATLVDFYGEATLDNKVLFDPGFRFGIGFGGEVTRHLCLEFQSGFHYNAIKSIAGASASSGNFYQVPLMGNVVLQLPNRTGFVPFVGAGAGAYWTVLDAQNLSIGGTTASGTDDAWVFGYQAFAGFRYALRTNLGLGASYHYGVATSPSWNSGAGNLKFSDARNHSFALSLHYRF